MSGIPLVFPEAHPCLERAPRALCVYLIVGCCWIRGIELHGASAG